jgi:protoporphyrinogen oxidase
MPIRAADTLERLAEQQIAIVGAGPTGLGAAYRLTELGLHNFTVFERDQHVGGLAASFRDAQGFTWDVGGHVQFSHYDYFDRSMDRVMGDDWVVHNRESWIWIRGRFVPYPLQNNIHLLPEAEKQACLIGLLRRRDADGPRPANFAEWVRAEFGDGLADTFMLPYNAKVWAYPPSDLDYGWVGERVAQIDLERVMRSLFSQRADLTWGPNRRFRFPARGGTGEIWRRVAASLPAGTLKLGADVSGIDLETRELLFSDGSSHTYDILISTMPLDRLAVMTDDAFASAASVLRYSTVHVLGIGLAGAPPPALAKKCWIYFPESECPYYRLTMYSNYSPSNVPDPAVYWSVMVEVSESPRKPLDHDRLPDAVIDSLHATGVITSKTEVVSRWQHTARHGYPTPFLGRDAVVHPLLDALERRRVFSRGRFGAWKYEVSNQDHAFMQGVELVNRFAFGLEETTIRRPDVVNARNRIPP